MKRNLSKLYKIVSGVLVFSLFQAMFISCGSKEPEMIVISDSYLSVSKTEITQGLYEKVMGNNPSMKKNKSFPVEQVKWFDALEFCNRLSEKEGLEKAYKIDGEKVSWNENANGYRLPTFKEFQFAAKGGQDYKYAGSDDCREVAFLLTDAQETKKYSETKVASKKPNGYGLFDMNGNVSEWCWNSAGSKNEYRIYAGGGWGTSAEYLTLDYKESTYPNQGTFYIGFRVVKTDVEKKAEIDEAIRIAEEKRLKEVEENRLAAIEEQKKTEAAEMAFEKSNPKLAVSNYLGMVKIPGKSISMSKYEVTQRVYEMVHGTLPEKTEIKGRKLPVTNVDWFNAVLFCNELTKYLMTEKDCVYTVKVKRLWQDKDIMEAEVTVNENAKGFRLPNEEEWVYAAKAGKNFKYPGSDNLSEVGWWNKNSNGMLHSVGQLKPNGYGLYDMAGNAGEWTFDKTGGQNERIVRGGSYTSNDRPCGFSEKSWIRQGESLGSGGIGIRVVKNE